jgi:NADH:ubiquinone oxidoreductase subunit B-like Fe-S oxidoreductase
MISDEMNRLLTEAFNVAHCTSVFCEFCPQKRRALIVAIEKLEKDLAETQQLLATATLNLVNTANVLHMMAGPGCPPPPQLSYEAIGQLRSMREMKE